MSTPSIFSKLVTLFRGKVTEAGTAVIDANAATIIDQEIRDARAAIDQGKRELATLMGQDNLLKREIEQLEASIQQDEKAARAALERGADELAEEVANRIVRTETALEAKRTMSVDYARNIATIKDNLDKSAGTIQQLEQRIQVAKAHQITHRARTNASLASGQANGRMKTAVDSLARMEQRLQQKTATQDALEQLAKEASGADLDERLRDAGITPGKQSAAAVLARLKQPSA
ncbi:hypothetical protein SB14R_03240 [Pseudomonas oryzihabitans]|nr:hypothetical protein NS376_08070 [Pseudomonas psychrotolerans]KTT26492.1 hypothetical protein SB14R_03240 [Pseudomonas psychrotolerans]KTT56688.1 hypothetical protein SB8_14635 [Pseudomonas psychrotolerans]